MQQKRPKKILLLGASGSIGKQTIDVIEQHPELFELAGVVCNTQAQYLKSIVPNHPKLQVVGVSDQSKKEELESLEIPILVGEDALEQAIEVVDYDILVNSVVGFRGLLPTLRSLEKGKDVALANKESLVVGGPLVLQALQKSNTRLFPIDSEHSAIFQCLQGNEGNSVRRLIITASGGSLRNVPREQLKEITPQKALAHPNWNMGQRITIDSSTMMNKGFEVIEAHYLFGVPFEKIDTVLHDESIVHSMVEFEDNSIMAQLGSPDMRLPIQYALSVPCRPILKEASFLDMSLDRTLHFKKMDFERFPLLKIAYDVGQKKGNAGAILNGADEQAVELFLQEKISFLDIEQAIAWALDVVPFIESPTYEQLKISDQQARNAVVEFMKCKNNKK